MTDITFYYKNIFVALLCMLTSAEEEVTCYFKFRTESQKLGDSDSIIWPCSILKSKQIAANWFKKVLKRSSRIYSGLLFYGRMLRLRRSNGLARTTEACGSSSRCHPAVLFHLFPTPPQELVDCLLICVESHNEGFESIIHNIGSPETQ